jgi:hypothetical protein
LLKLLSDVSATPVCLHTVSGYVPKLGGQHCTAGHHYRSQLCPGSAFIVPLDSHNKA